MNKDFWHQTVTTQQIETYISQRAGVDLSKVFDQYLRDTRIPLLQYRIEGSKLSFKYDRVVDGFAMPIRIAVNGKESVIVPNAAMQTMTFPADITSVEVNRNYLAESELLK